MNRYGIYERAQNVVDILFDWTGESLPDSDRAKWIALRKGVPTTSSSTAVAQKRPAIVFDGDLFGRAENPRIEHIAEDDPRYVFYFCSVMMAQVADRDFGRSLIRRALQAEQRKLQDPEAMGQIYDQLLEGLWISDFDFAKRWCLICHTPPEFLERGADTADLAEAAFRLRWKSVRTRLEELRDSAETLDDWWYGLHCCRPYMYMAEYLAGEARNKALAKKTHRFVDEIETDFSMTLNSAYRAWLQDRPKEVAHLILDIRSLAEIGVTLRHADGHLERVKTDAPSDALERAVEGMKFELAARFRWPKSVYLGAFGYLHQGKRIHLDDEAPRICLDFSPTLIAAIRTLSDGKLSGR
jgi:hypothetical protein